MMPSAFRSRRVWVVPASFLLLAPLAGQAQLTPQSSVWARPVRLRGTVVLENGTRAPAGVVVEVACDGSRIPEAYTDSKGRFSFQFGGDREVIADARYNKGGFRYDPVTKRRVEVPRGADDSIRRSLAGCLLRAVYAGYYSDPVVLGQHNRFAKPDVGAIVLRRRKPEGGQTISATTLFAPRKARRAHERGLKAMKREEWDTAEHQLRIAVTTYPEFAAAWEALGTTYEAQNRVAEALNAYNKAADADDQFVSPLLKAAHLAVKHERWDEAVAATDRVKAISVTEYPEADFYAALAHYNLKDYAAAEHAARAAIAHQDEKIYAQAEHILGMLLFGKGDWRGAHTHLREYLALVPRAPNAEAVRNCLVEIEQKLATLQAGR